jgi:hypothetical protein
MATSLHEAAFEGQHKVVHVRQLLAAGADVNEADSTGRKPLIAAASSGQHDVVQVLLEAGAVLDAKDEDGITPLHAAAEKGHLQVVKLLLAAGTPVNTPRPDHGRTPLYAAATARHTDVVQLLLQKGADPYPENRSGGTSVSVAAARGYDDVVELLLEAWGQYSLTAAQLVYATKVAACNDQPAAFAKLIKKLQEVYPEDMMVVFQDYRSDSDDDSSEEGELWEEPATFEFAMEAVLKQWTSEISSITAQKQAVQQREAAVEQEKRGMQQLLVCVAQGMAKPTQQDPADAAAGSNPLDGQSRKRQRLSH